MDLMLLRIYQRFAHQYCIALLRAGDELNAALAETHRVYQEIRYASHDTRRELTRQLDTLRPLPWIEVHSLLSSAAILSRLFWGQGGKRESERAPLRVSLGVDEGSPLRDVDMRNRFEHIDQRIQQWWDESESHNFVDGSIGRLPPAEGPGIDPSIDIFRWLDPAAQEVIFWGQRFSLKAVILEAQRILPIAAAECMKPHWTPPPHGAAPSV